MSNVYDLCISVTNHNALVMYTYICIYGVIMLCIVKTA